MIFSHPFLRIGAWDINLNRVATVEYREDSGITVAATVHLLSNQGGLNVVAIDGFDALMLREYIRTRCRGYFLHLRRSDYSLVTLDTAHYRRADDGTIQAVTLTWPDGWGHAFTDDEAMQAYQHIGALCRDRLTPVVAEKEKYERQRAVRGDTQEGL